MAQQRDKNSQKLQNYVSEVNEARPCWIYIAGIFLALLPRCPDCTKIMFKDQGVLHYQFLSYLFVISVKFILEMQI